MLVTFVDEQLLEWVHGFVSRNACSGEMVVVVDRISAEKAK